MSPALGIVCLANYESEGFAQVSSTIDPQPQPESKKGAHPGFGPLRGLKVLEAGTLIAGPFGASLMADFGAEVIKIEQPETGDPIRRVGFKHAGGDSLTWSSIGRNKRVVTLNLNKEKGQELFRRLAGWADIVIENFSPGTMERWNLGWDQLHSINPRLIMIRVSGFGQTGPYRHKPGLDRIALGFSGVSYVTGYPDRPPLRSLVPLADYFTGTFAAAAALMAIYERDVLGSGCGQMIDLALYEPLFRISEGIVTAYGYTGHVSTRMGNINPNTIPGETFLAADGKWVILHAGFDQHFWRLARLMGREDLVTDPRYATISARAQHAEELHKIVGAWVRQFSARQVLAMLDAERIPAGLVYSIADIFEDPHYQARDNLIQHEDDRAGTLHLPGIIPKFSRTPGRVVASGPPLGAHNEWVYGELLGLTVEEQNQLKNEGVI